MPDRNDREREGYPAEQARQGRIVLNTPARRYIFFGGLIGIVALLIILMIVRLAATA
jgi:hypothetical protein